MQALAENWGSQYLSRMADRQVRVLLGRMLSRKAELETTKESESTLRRAQEELQAIVTVDSVDYVAWIALGDVHRMLAARRPGPDGGAPLAEAEEVYQRAIRIDADRPDGYSGLIAVAEERARFDSGSARANQIAPSTQASPPTATVTGALVR